MGPGVSYGFTLLRRSAESAHSTEAHERPQGKRAAPTKGRLAP